MAMVLASAEGEDGTWGWCADVHTWQRAEETAGAGARSARYLAWLLRETGYRPSEMEMAVIAACGPARRPRTATSRTRALRRPLTPPTRRAAE